MLIVERKNHCKIRGLTSSNCILVRYHNGDCSMMDFLPNKLVMLMSRIDWMNKTDWKKDCSLDCTMDLLDYAIINQHNKSKEKKDKYL